MTLLGSALSNVGRGLWQLLGYVQLRSGAAIAAGDLPDPQRPEFFTGEGKAAFNDAWETLASVVWWLALCGAILYLLRAFVRYASGRRLGDPERITDSMREIKMAVVGILGLAALPLLVRVVLDLITTITPA